MVFHKGNDGIIPLAFHEQGYKVLYKAWLGEVTTYEIAAVPEGQISRSNAISIPDPDCRYEVRQGTTGNTPDHGHTGFRHPPQSCSLITSRLPLRLLFSRYIRSHAIIACHVHS